MSQSLFLPPILFPESIACSQPLREPYDYVSVGEPVAGGRVGSRMTASPSADRYLLTTSEAV